MTPPLPAGASALGSTSTFLRELCSCDALSYTPGSDAARFVAGLEAASPRLARKAPDRRRLVLISGGDGDHELAGAILALLRALADAGYDVRDAPADRATLLNPLRARTVNEPGGSDPRMRESLSLADYQLFFAALGQELRDSVTARWGAPEADPAYHRGATDCGAFLIPAVRYGAVAVGWPRKHVEEHSSPRPSHRDLAFCAWLCDSFRADAIVYLCRDGDPDRRTSTIVEP